MSFISAVRSRTFSTLAMLVIIGAALLSVPAVANAAPTPYPPTNPSSGVAPTSVHRDTNNTNQTSETASTGFATLTATGIALALLGGGIALVVVGRRRRRA